MDTRTNVELTLTTIRVLPDLRAFVAHDHQAIMSLIEMDNADEHLVKKGYEMAHRQNVVLQNDVYQITTWIDKSTNSF